MTRWLPAGGILLAALLVFSCQKASRPAAPPPPAPLSFPALPSAGGSPPAGAPAAGAQSAPAVPSPAQAPGMVPAGPAQPSGGQKPAPGGIALQPQAAAPASKGLASAGSLVALGRDGRVLPEDFKIGPLGDAQVEDKDQGQAMETAGAFLAALVGGKVEKDLLAQDERDAMADMLTYGLSKDAPPTSWRLGRPRTRPDGEVTAAVRLFSKDGSSEGEIYVARSGAKWLVSDLQISLAQLSVKSEKPKEKFLPLDYRWLLEE